MRHVLTSEVERELEEAVAYYDGCANGLGDQFLEEFEAGIRRIAAFPEAWTSISPTLRKCIVHRFPYSIIYSIETDRVLVVALMHMRRMPRNWQ